MKADNGAPADTRVLILHPEGSFNYNVNLIGLAEIWAEAGYRVTIAAGRRAFRQDRWTEGISVYLWPKVVDRMHRQVLEGRALGALATLLLRAAFRPFRAGLYIGVDREGIVLAATLAKPIRSPHGLVSYEIMFAHETSQSYKAPEIVACRDIAFAVAQDPIRAGMLARENDIPMERILQVPVAGRGTRQGRPGVLRSRLGIDPDVRIALYMGSVEPWAMIDELVATTDRWPQSWCLVIHDRFGAQTDRLNRTPAAERTNVYLSSERADTANGLGDLLGDADVGVGLYRPTDTNPYLGDNLRHLGLASGKISTYFQYGLPVLTNDVGLYGALMKGRNVGQTVRSVDEVPGALGRIPKKSPGTTERCHALFLEFLDLNAHRAELLTAVERSVAWNRPTRTPS